MKSLLLLTALLLTSLAMPAPPAVAQEEASADWSIPNFWDPKRRTERPPAGAVDSIRFTTTDDFPPFNFVDVDGRLTGFHIDLARAICAELDIPCTIQARPWDSIFDALKENRADAAIAGIGLSAGALDEVDFTDIYMMSPARFAVRTDRPLPDISPSGLATSSIAVVARSAHEAYLSAFFPDVARKPFDDAAAARQAMKDGAVGAYFGDGIETAFWLESEAAEGCCRFAGGPYLDATFFGPGHAIAVKRGANELRRAINAALEAIHASGTYAELYLRYFPVGLF